MGMSSVGASSAGSVVSNVQQRQLAQSVQALVQQPPVSKPVQAKPVGAVGNHINTTA